jgi:uncharacterized protein
MMKAFDVSVAVFVRGLTNLEVLLAKGEAHAMASGMDAGALLHARLADDMYDLATQAHWAAEGARLAVAQLLGGAPSPLADAGKTFAELRERTGSAIADLRATDPAALEAGLERTIALHHRGTSRTFRGDRYLMEFAIPSFFFHVTAAYAILRHQGVPLQKGDFMGA